MMSKNPVIQAWTKEELIRVAQQSQPDLVHCFMPTINLFYSDFKSVAHIQHESFVNYLSTSLAQKKALFQDIGFDVLLITPYATDAIRFVSKLNGSESLHDEYLDNKRNIFTFWIESDSNDLLFVVEYTDLADPLADHVVDPIALAEHKKTQAAVRGIMDNIRNKNQN